MPADQSVNERSHTGRTWKPERRAGHDGRNIGLVAHVVRPIHGEASIFVEVIRSGDIESGFKVPEKHSIQLASRVQVRVARENVDFRWRLVFLRLRTKSCAQQNSD